MLDSIYHMILKYFEIVLMLLLGCCCFLLYILLYMHDAVKIQHYKMLLNMYYTSVLSISIYGIILLPDVTSYDKYMFLLPK